MNTILAILLLFALVLAFLYSWRKTGSRSIGCSACGLSPQTGCDPENGCGIRKKEQK